MTLPGRRGRWALAFAIFFIAGCAEPLRATGQFDSKTGPWTGRLALQVKDDQIASFSAAFELKGRAEAGELTLFTPLGATAAVLRWEPGLAVLKGNGQVQQFESVDALMAAATGSAVPIAVLFDWLAGTNTAVAGWQADLSGLGAGFVIDFAAVRRVLCRLEKVFD